MLFKQHILKGIAEGRITNAFRRWRRPSVKAGGSLKTPVGVLHIQSVDMTAARQAGFESVEDLLKSLGDRDGQMHRVKFRRVGDDPRIAVRASDKLNETEFKAIQTRPARLDHRSKRGPCTIRVLRLIERFPERRAVELAGRSGFEKGWLKLNIRKLKNFGLTQSLKVGYRLSPPGASVPDCG